MPVQPRVRTQRPGRIRVALYNALRRLRPIQVGEAIKKLVGIRRFHFQLPDGRIYWIDPVSNLGLFLLNEGTYEEAMGKAIRGLLQPGDRFIDVGANEGYFSVLAAQCVGSGGAVHAVEPQSRLQRVIRRNAEANGVAGVVSVHRLGLADREGQQDLFLTADVNTGASSFTKHWKVGGRKESIRTTTLDAFAREQGLDRVRLLKVDCEGAERVVIPGAEGLLREGRIERLILEYHPHIIGAKACDDLHEFLRGLGYTPLPDTGALRIYAPGGK